MKIWTTQGFGGKKKDKKDIILACTDFFIFLSRPHHVI